MVSQDGAESNKRRCVDRYSAASQVSLTADHCQHSFQRVLARRKSEDGKVFASNGVANPEY